jgi:hypothetical protein
MTKFEIDTSEGIKISSDLNDEDVSSIQNVHPRDIGNGYVWYWLPPTAIDNLNVVFGVCFFEGKLQSVNISLSNPEIYGGGWDDFSEAKEKLRAQHTAEWLAKRGYKLGEFDWGSIWSGYDSKGGFGHAVVRYNS